MKKYFTFLFLIFAFTHVSAQFSSAELIRTYSTTELSGIAAGLGVPSFIINPEFEVDVYKITYETPHPNGFMTIATGALCIPKSDCDFPITSYQHGTVALKTNVPSYSSPELNVGLLYATTGYIMCLPDYIGLGDSPGLHPYVHAKSEATASVDMIKASKIFADQENVNYNDQLMILGYSQGGHATMALHKEIQENFSDELTVTASFPLSGPYDVSGVQTAVIVGDDPYPTPGYLPYILFAYNSVYGTLFNDPSEIFVEPYDELLPTLFDGTKTMGEINALCAPVPKSMLKPAVVDSFQTDPNHRFWIALRDNDLYDWTPETPVRIYYCEGDDQVNFMNSIVALDAFNANNAPDVTATNLGDGDHGECYGPAVFATKLAMDGFKEACITSTSSIEITDITISPNPASDKFQVTLEEEHVFEELVIYDYKGAIIHQQNISSKVIEIECSDYSKGIYFIQFKGDTVYTTKMTKL